MSFQSHIKNRSWFNLIGRLPAGWKAKLHVRGWISVDMPDGGCVWYNPYAISWAEVMQERSLTGVQNEHRICSDEVGSTC